MLILGVSYIINPEFKILLTKKSCIFKTTIQTLNFNFFFFKAPPNTSKITVSENTNLPFVNTEKLKQTNINTKTVQK